MKCHDSQYWRGCYRGTFDLITPKSVAHPAKMSPALCFRIFSHLEELGLLKQGDTILDPMGGTGLTAICAGAKGYPAITVELEEKFVGFQKQNKGYAERKLHHALDWQILQGDSRKLSELLQGEGLRTVTSPPYADAQTGGGIAVNGYQGPKHTPTDLVGKRSYMPDVHGTAVGQIGNLKDIPLKAVTSPPYGELANSKKNTGSNLTKEERIALHGARTGEVSEGMRYSNNQNNIGNLPDRPLKSVTSPPYEGDPGHHGNDLTGIRSDKKLLPDYGSSEGQIGDTQFESYLSAMQTVYSEIARVSDVLVVVLKNPTRAGKLRRLDLDSIRILEATGWKILCQHRALLFEELEQSTLFGEPEKKVKGRLSFLEIILAKGESCCELGRYYFL